MSTPKRQVHLAAHFPGVNSTTVWSDPRAESQIEFASFEHFARNAEKGLFDYLFLAEGLRLREHKGRIHDLDVVGRPNTLAVLAAVAAVTEHIGLVGTLSSTFNEPYEFARQLATLDHLSNGRAGWNVVTSPDAFHGANFRRGAFLDREDRYARAAEFVSLAKELWNSWDAGAIVADAAAGRFLAEGALHPVEHRGPHFTASGFFNVPRSPQGSPVIVQAGDSPAGRDFASEHAEVVFSRHASLEDGKGFYRDVKGRLAAWGRTEDSLKILPAATFTIGDTLDEARDLARQTALAQVGPQTAIAFLEQAWARDLSGYDPDGPLPDIDPDYGGTGVVAGRANAATAGPEQVRRWRDLAAAEKLSIRELVIRLSARESFVGTAARIAETIDRHVQERASDGFVIVGTTNPYGLDGFVDKVVPELQERGVYRTAYDAGATLRDTLRLPAPREARVAVG